MVSKIESDAEINIDIEDQEIDANFFIISIITIIIYLSENYITKIHLFA